MKIEIVYCKNSKELINLDIELAPNSTAADALEKLAQIYPDITSTNIGVFGQKVNLSYVLNSVDRLEIYRPLLINPKEKRKLLTKKKTPRNISL